MKQDQFEKLLVRIEKGEIPAKKLKVLYGNAKEKSGGQGQELMSHIIKYSQINDPSLYRKLVPGSNVGRKEFMTKEGFTCANWTWSWSFVNHEKKVVAFGAWNVHYLDDNSVVILSDNWSGDERKSAGYTQAIKHIGLSESDNYRYQVFNMIHGGTDEKGKAKIEAIDPTLRDALVRKVGPDWIATVTAID